MIPYKVDTDLRNDLNKATNVILDTVKLCFFGILYWMTLLSFTIIFLGFIGTHSLFIITILVLLFIALIVIVAGIIKHHRRLMRCK